VNDPAGVDPEATFRTPRLRLEALRAEHAAVLFDGLSAPRNYHYLPTDPPRDAAALAARYRLLEARRSPDGTEHWLNWAVIPDEGFPVGVVQATVREDGTALLAYELAPQAQGRGYATESCTEVVERLFADYGVSEVLAEVDTRNVPSIALLERLGFERVAFRPHADYFKGAASDEYTYRRLAR